MPFQGGAGAIGDHRGAMGGAGLDDGRNLFRAVGIGDTVGRRRGVIGLALAMMFAHRGRGGETIAKQFGQFCVQGFRQLSVGVGIDGKAHGGYPFH